MPKRRLDLQLPEPERASAMIISECRRSIDGAAKRIIRRALLPLLKRYWRLSELGEGFHWPSNMKLKIAPGSRIGRYAYIGEGFDGSGPVVVGDLCMISAGLHIFGADHDFEVPGLPTRLGFPQSARPVTTFGLDAWVGRDVLVREGVYIGAGAVVASGSVVTRNIEPYTIVAGIPAKIIRQRFPAGSVEPHEARIRKLRD